MATNRVVIGLASNHAQAETIVNDLRASGFWNNNISVLFPSMKITRDFALEQNTKAPEGAIAGVGAGGLLGGTLGLLAGLGALLIPGIGPIIAAGPLVAMLTGAAAGATVGGVAGALIGLGIPEVEAKQYEGEIKSGNILISVHAADANERAIAKRVFERHGATSILAIDEKHVQAAKAA